MPDSESVSTTGRSSRRRGPRFRGRGKWPFQTFALSDPGEQEACRLAQRLAQLLLRSMAEDGCSMRQLARDSGVDVTTVKSVLEGTYGPRLETAVRLLVARRIPVSQLTTNAEIDLTDSALGRIPVRPSESA
jgi:hypothetical protein